MLSWREGNVSCLNREGREKGREFWHSEIRRVESFGAGETEERREKKT